LQKESLGNIPKRKKKNWFFSLGENQSRHAQRGVTSASAGKKKLAPVASKKKALTFNRPGPKYQWEKGGLKEKKEHHGGGGGKKAD